MDDVSNVRLNDGDEAIIAELRAVTLTAYSVAGESELSRAFAEELFVRLKVPFE